jgi:hypothetical protein
MVDETGNAILVDAQFHHFLYTHLAGEGALPDNWRYLPAPDIYEGIYINDYSRDVYAFGNLLYEVREPIF